MNLVRRYPRSLAYSAVALLLTGMVAASSTPAEARPKGADRPHTACEYEDSQWCVWLASGPGAAGNGVGESFWSGREYTDWTYITAKQARCLLKHKHSRCGT